MLPSVEGSLKKLVLRLNKTHDGVKEKETMIALGQKHSIEVEFDVMSFSRGALSSVVIVVRQLTGRVFFLRRKESTREDMD